MLNIVHFADSLNLDTNRSLSQHFNTKNCLSLSECDFKAYRKDYKFKRALVTIVLKINRYFIMKGWGHDEDLLPLYNLSPTIVKIFDEEIYMETLKERKNQEIQIMTASGTKTFILTDKSLSKDKKLIRLLLESVPTSPSM